MEETINPKPHHGNTWMPVMYATFYGILKDIAQKHGYALAVHGSFTRDMDLVAIPWTEYPSDPLLMIREMYTVIGDYNSEDACYSSMEVKLHGRTAYTLPTGGGGYVDLSVMRLDVPSSV